MGLGINWEMRKMAKRYQSEIKNVTRRVSPREREREREREEKTGSEVHCNNRMTSRPAAFYVLRFAAKVRKDGNLIEQQCVC